MTNEATGGADGAAVLDPIEIRVLAVLAEKEALTPDNYPMSLNAIVNGCNQLSSRDPVMQLTDEVVQDTLQRLIERKLVNGISQAGARVTKYEHRMRIKWTLEQDKVAVLAVLMLRGLQTAGEIRTRTGRLHEFKSVAEVETALQFLIDKYPPLVARLERAPGTKEPRYGHLLGGEITIVAGSEQVNSAAAGMTQGGRIGQLEQEVAALRGELEDLKAQFEAFRQQFQ
ncbi:YceH family protein [Massilia sp. ZL223]|uniref:YceH family protein n=1 Tax=Massilia sp. ZL223 TaxID=2824904 RepID=UPI001B82B415|nr:YceH family protein [Massilia sp. ZL223]MBQ5965174.1 YceH family protein [Massilia sp. ZL223]